MTGAGVPLRGRILPDTERKGHRFVELDALVIVDGDALVACIRHDVIWRLRGASCSRR